MMKKILAWIRDNWDLPYWKCYWAWSDIRCWWRHNMNTSHLKLVREAWLSYPFDYAFLYRLEKEKLQEMYDYFSKAKYISYDNYEAYCRDISICVKLIDIFIEEDPYVKEYVNMKNLRRFMDDFTYEEKAIKFFKEYPGVLRARKARQLYHKIRLYKTESWWD